MLHWEVPEELSAEELGVAQHLKRTGKFYLFLRQNRHRLFDREMEAHLAEAYEPPRGVQPLPPALLATVLLLQAYDKTGDAKAVLRAATDRCWQLVLGNLGEEAAPFSQGVLVSFRERVISHNLDQKLLDKTVELAKDTGQFNWQHLRAQLDSSPLLGAGRVEDTWNLIGRALSLVVDCAAKNFGQDREEIIHEVGLELLSGSSLKATLDIDWDDAEQKRDALERLLREVETLQNWVKKQSAETESSEPLAVALGLLTRVVEQDTEPDPEAPGHTRIRTGTAKDRMPSLGDQELRHGRKSRSKRFNGYKRHIVQVGEPALIVGAIVKPANEPEQEAACELLPQALRQGELEKVDIDRGYLGSGTVAELYEEGVVINCKAWPQRNSGRYTKSEFELRLEEGIVVCPAGQQTPISKSGKMAHFAAEVCGQCEQQAQCTKAKTGRSISIHEEEGMLMELRERQRGTEGRAELRKRVKIEHNLAKVEQVQGERARYKGARKNTMDVRRCAVVVNLQTIQRMAKAA